jgi:hypothetical protein
MTYVHTGLPILTKTAQRSFSVAAHQIQDALKAEGQLYDIRDINDALAQWLESSIEQLCEEACEMCVTGDRNLGSFNRSAFSDALMASPSIDLAEAELSRAPVLSEVGVMDLEIAA